MEVRLHHLADADLLRILEYYQENAGSDIAEAFYTEFLGSLTQIAERPASFPKQNYRLRRANLNRFPYHLLFEELPEGVIQILVIKHDRRRPSYGLRRR